MKIFTKTELAIIKFKLIKRGYSPEQAQFEVANLIKTAQVSHITALESKKAKKRCNARELTRSAKQEEVK